MSSISLGLRVRVEGGLVVLPVTWILMHAKKAGRLDVVVWGRSGPRMGVKIWGRE